MLLNRALKKVNKVSFTLCLSYHTHQAAALLTPFYASPLTNAPSAQLEGQLGVENFWTPWSSVRGPGSAGQAGCGPWPSPLPCLYLALSLTRSGLPDARMGTPGSTLTAHSPVWGSFLAVPFTLGRVDPELRSVQALEAGRVLSG